MKTGISILLFVLGINCAFGQIANIAEKFDLPVNLTESSGAIFFNDNLITHTDSGGENKLYELDTISGLVTRAVSITNATNSDWEAITQDDTSIYIGDIGNNNGTRTDLKIYKISKSDYTSSTGIMAETIAFNYSDQTDFTSNPNNTIWDAEALISFDDNNLILFTKNWVDGVTKGYVIPKTAGTYTVSPLSQTLESDGLTTGGTFNRLTGKLYLVGYSKLLLPFVWECSNFDANEVFSGTNIKTMLSSLGQEQIEAIAHVDANRYLITSEFFNKMVGGLTFTDTAKLMAFSTSDVELSNPFFKDKHEVVLYPNPVSHILKVKSLEMVSIELFDTKMTRLYAGNDTNTSLDMSSFSPGIYIVKIWLNSNRIIIKKIIKK
ncbi:T9SS type A sorting domain-containing protein [Algibacter sp. 2305UL17-15]|uniref:T9SS type A sorting domain-containing protein n=1 Tax=Algibacter sp. 2305UL17-15 TaxID=3231268 RepID=UPI003459513B